MFKLPSCTLTAPCFARSNGYCRILRDFDPRWQTRGCPFQKETRAVTGVDEQVIKLYNDGLTLMRIGIAVERSEEFVSGVVERLICRRIAHAPLRRPLPEPRSDGGGEAATRTGV